MIPTEIFEKIRHIQMRTSQLADDVFAGAWHSAFKGQGMEFEEVREYQPGDDIHSIDWPVTAHMNQPFVKVFREERQLTVMLVVDISASTCFGTQQGLKRDLIAEIGAVLAFSAIKNQDKVGLILFSKEVEKYVPPKKGVRHVLRVIRELLVFQPKHAGTDMDSALAFLGGIVKKSCICFLISDFICSQQEHRLSLLAKRHDLIAIAVTDPCELEFPDIGVAALKNLETDVVTIVDTSEKKIQKTFRQRGKERLQTVKRMMQKVGAGFIDIRTDQSYLDAMRKFFKTRKVIH